MSRQPHDFWQEIAAPGTIASGDAWSDVFAARLPDGREIAFPVRPLPGDGARAVVSLIVNQASFAVEDALADAMAERARAHAPEVVVGVPTLGLPLANAVARRLGHARMVALGTSRKFWYEDALSVPVSSITSPDQVKRMYLDPRMLAVLAGRRVILVDDVISTGRTTCAVLELLEKGGVRPVAAVFAMAQGRRWLEALAECGRGDLAVESAVETPLLRRGDDGLYRAED